MDLTNIKDKLLRLLLKTLGWCFALEALTISLALGFAIKGVSLISLSRLLEPSEPTFIGSLSVVWGCLVVSTTLIGYYLLAYAFVRYKYWGIPLAIVLNALLFAEELWRSLFPWNVSRERVRALVQDMATSGGYVFKEEILEVAWAGTNQTATPFELAGRASLTILLLLIFKNSHLLPQVK